MNMSFLEMTSPSPYLSAAEKEEAKRLMKEVSQLHHDYYVSLKRAGRLTEFQQEDFELAMKRESDGDVDPLDEGGEIEILEKLKNLKENSSPYGL